MNTRKFNNVLAYLSVILIAISTVVSFLATKVFDWGQNIADICKIVSFALAGFVTLICAFLYAGSRRNTAFMLVLIIAVIVYAVFTFIL